MLAVTTESLLSTSGVNEAKAQLKKRGVNVYTTSELVGVAGIDREGKILTGSVEVPLFGLSIYDRLALAQRCDSVFGVISGRSNRISGLEWDIKRESREEDRIVANLKMQKQVYMEYAGRGIRELVIRGRMVQEITRVLPDVLPDLSNFDGAMLRWRKRLQNKNDDASQEIKDWLHEPNTEDDFEDFLKKWVFDLMVHGSDAIYKETVGERLENLYHLPGGSVQPLKNRFVSASRGFVQAMPGMDAKIYWQDEIAFSTYMPNSGVSYGLVPLEALVNKVAETLLFDQRSAEMADGTVPPQKIALFGENAPFGDLTGDEAFTTPLNQAEQSKIESLLNEPRKDAIRVLSGYGTPAILDLSRSETYASQIERQRMIRETVAFVYNMSNMEINLTGSEETSGRSTSDAQARIEKEKGISPIVKMIENKLNREILPLRYGSGYLFEFKSGMSDEEQVQLETIKKQSGTYTVNEIRLESGREPIGPEGDSLPDAQATQPDGSGANPFNMKTVGQPAG